MNRICRICRICRIGRFEQTIRNSRFIGVCGPADDEASARAFIQAHGAPGCRHVCFAHRCGETVRFDNAGGLARAYGGTAMQAIADAGIEPVIETVVLECRVPFDSAGDLHQLVERTGASKPDEHWDESGLRLVVEIERDAADAFVEELTAVTRGEASAKLLEDESEDQRP